LFEVLAAFKAELSKRLVPVLENILLPAFGLALA
jgi:hypothetical protein